MIREQEVAEGTEDHEIDLEDAPEGMYFLEIQTGAERVWQKMVVQR
jgi:hypothetical protein